MIVGDFGEDYEMTVPFQALQAVGHEVDAVCPEKDTGDTVKTAVHDFRGDQTYMESRGRDFALTEAFDEVVETVRHFADEDEPIAAICHAAQILAAADVIEGRTYSANPALKTDVEDAGGEYYDGVTTDGNLVTGRDWGDHVEWLSQFLDVLGTAVEHERTVTADD